MINRSLWIRLIILLLTVGLQFHQLGRDIRFHPDEAFFMTFARNASVNGDWMLSGALDKPPLSIYGSALSMMIFGITTDANGVYHLDVHIGEFAGRLPNVMLGILSVALMMRIAHRVYQDDHTAHWTGLFMATSAYLTGFGATAFTDMSLLFLLMLALWLSIRRQFAGAMMVLALAFWSKQQAIFYLPLIIWIGYRQSSLSWRDRRLIGAILIIALLFVWDATRPDTSIFVLGTLNNTPDSILASPAGYPARLLTWANWGLWLLAHPLVTVGVLLFVITAGVWQKKQQINQSWDRIWLISLLGYVGLHTILTFNQYDRYLLLILPMAVLLGAHGLQTLIKRLNGGYWLNALMVICVIIGTLVTTITGNPIGGDKGDYHGIDRLADYLNDKPVATVIYDRWLGWELGYYMGQWTNKRRVYYPTPQALVRGALELDERGDRYLVAPVDRPIDIWLEALKEVGFGVELDYEQDRFRVYRLSVPALDA